MKRIMLTFSILILVTVGIIVSNGDYVSTEIIDPSNYLPETIESIGLKRTDDVTVFKGNKIIRRRKCNKKCNKTITKMRNNNFFFISKIFNYFLFFVKISLFCYTFVTVFVIVFKVRVIIL